MTMLERPTEFGGDGVWKLDTAAAGSQIAILPHVGLLRIPCRLELPAETLRSA